MLTYFEGQYEISILVSLSILSLSVFFISYFYDRRRLITGFLFNLFLFFTIITISFIAVTSNNLFLELLVLMFSLVIFGVLVFGIYALIVGLLINAKIVIKHEQKSILNLLTLFFGVALIGYLIIDMVNIDRFFTSDINAFLSVFHIIGIFCIFDVFNFLMSSFIYQLNKPKLNQDFIIVLGGGLIGDRVPPLLASRIEKSIEFYNKQSEVTNPPKIIFSGGQGSDEKISEALAMQLYAIGKGVPSEDTILEDKSVSTLQNMAFSKNIMDSLMPKNYNSIFVTNNYHLFRGGIYARLTGLKSQGIGSKTAPYFLPNAMIREYIAIVAMHKKRYIIIVILILIFSLILAILPHLSLLMF
ncbi:YdcF family protein [Clostridium tagluense]|uniref:YdcF family protein n=1 Tax=Clostridium tagluense TaxID=360422 RepID=UPI001C0D4EF8|nr:YdcF family protein [Clostridium tagluense]MBU3127612.1 YdcF family protein [Clostridium tagluense]